MREIVVCGEALVDVVESRADRPVPGRLAPLCPAVGGGPFNTAITLGRLGSTVSLCTAVSTDHYGDALVAALQASGVGTTLVQRRPEPTTLALATVGADGSAQYTFYVDGTADRNVADPGTLAPTVAAMCFGTLSMVLEPGATVYENLLRRSHADGRLVVCDPNIRAAVIPDADAYRRRFASWLPHVDVVKCSDEDAAWLGAGRDPSTVADWLDAGVAAVVITGGRDGVSVTTPAGSIAAPVRQVQVADTIGAGDSVLGALLHRLDRDGALTPADVRRLGLDDWRRIAEFAVQVAGVTVSRPGADPPWASELASD